MFIFTEPLCNTCSKNDSTTLACGCLLVVTIAESCRLDSVLFSPRRGNILRIDNLVQSGGEVIAVSTWAFDTVGSNECTKGIILAAPR